MTAKNNTAPENDTKSAKTEFCLRTLNTTHETLGVDIIAAADSLRAIGSSLSHPEPITGMHRQ